MKPESDTRVLLFLRRFTSLASLTAASIGLIVLFGWFLNIPILKSFLPGLPAMRFNAALSLFLLGSSLWLLKDEQIGLTRKRLGQGLAGFVLLLNLLTLGEYLFSWNLGIDEFFVQDLDSPPDLFPGRIAPLVILCAGLSSLSLLRLGSRIARYFCYFVVTLSIMIVLNNLFDFQLLPRNSQATFVPVHTGLAFLALALAILAARPAPELIGIFSSDLPGTRAMRFLLLGIVVLTLSIAWLLEQGESLGILDPSKGSTLLVVLLIFTYSPLIYFIARNINQTHHKLLLSDQILERVNALVLVADTQGSITYVSPSVKSILGFEPSELLGEGWWKISRATSMDDQAERTHILSVAGQNTINSAPYEREIQDRWGNTHWIMWVDAPGPDASVIGVGHDITERKRAEEKLRQSEENFSKAFSSSPMALMITRLADGKYLELNAAYTNLVGYDRADLLGHLSTEFNIFKNPDQRKEIVNQLLANRALYNYEAQIQNKAGEPRTVLASLEQIQFNGEGCILTTMVDITERKTAEQALLQSEKELRTLSEVLEQRVVERTADLRRVNTELERASHAKDEFLANMSHELRTPLNSILGMSELLLEQVRGSLNEYQQKALGLIQSSGQHLLELINDILDLSKIEAGKLELHPEIIEVLKVCETSLTFVREQAIKKSIFLEFQPQPAGHLLAADPRYLKQILVNLLTNAVKFTPANGHVTLKVSTDADRGLMQFSVSDTGIGISPEDLNYLFQPFVQVDSSLNRQYEGTGLGLALVQRLIDLHGGSIQVESEVGRGSRFMVNLPWQPDMGSRLADEQTESILKDRARMAASVSSAPVHRGRILLAEDNPANILTIGEYLENKQYSVVVAHNGLEAITRATEFNPNIILMDIQMPVMDGLEAMLHLRADPRFRSVPIVALTALAMPGDRERCLQAGASEYLSKPVSLKELVTMIEHLTGQDE